MSGQNWVFSKETTSLTLMKLCLFHVQLWLCSRNFTILFSLNLQKCVFNSVDLITWTSKIPPTIRNLLFGGFRTKKKTTVFVIRPIVKWHIWPRPVQTTAPLKISTERSRLNDHFPHRSFPKRLEDDRDPGKGKKKRVTIRNANRLKLIKGCRVWFYLTLK